jgi:hypothetical protein
MKQLIIVLFSFVAIFSGYCQESYETYFTEARLRMDFYHYGTQTTEKYILKEYIREDIWSGSKANINSDLLHGSYLIQIKNDEKNKLLYQQAFNTLFEEWQDTEEATDGKEKIFEESFFCPFPKEKIHISILARNDSNQFVPIWESTFQPDSNNFIHSHKKSDFVRIHGEKELNKAVDVAIIAEGYTQYEIDKFLSDANRFTHFFLNTAPFNAYKEHFNFFAVKSISPESGTDLPGLEIYKETVADTRFYTFDSERYLTSTSYHKCMDLTANVPHDQIIILVNSDKYGGGGIFNHFSVVSSDHYLSEIVLTHEFGHAFGGLADEYYTSSTAYIQHPDLRFELVEPNVTNLVNFEIKWENMLNDDTPIPTPDTEKYDNILGVFEGGRYLEKGIYRPARNCRMKSNTADFCPVCQKVLIDFINYHINK